MLQFWTLYLTGYTEVIITMKHQQTGLLKRYKLMTLISEMKLTFHLASILHRILISWIDQPAVLSVAVRCLSFTSHSLSSLSHQVELLYS